MYDPDPTRTSMLLAMHGSDDGVWRGFDARYRPMILAFARRRGLDDDSAAEIVQETLTQVVRDYRSGRYVRSRGRLRSWVLGIARHRISDAQRAAGTRPVCGESGLLVTPDHRIGSAAEREQEGEILRRALDQLRSSPRMSPGTLRAFELLVLRAVPADAVAAECGLSVDEVYRIKHRVTMRLRQIIGTSVER